jgi:hypothetical protein
VLHTPAEVHVGRVHGDTDPRVDGADRPRVWAGLETSSTRKGEEESGDRLVEARCRMASGGLETRSGVNPRQ